MNIRKIAYGGLLIAAAILIPQAFHLTGLPQAGQVFLPMHIPVLLSGFVLGPYFGLAVGAASPLISAAMTGMPPVALLPFMVIELAAYGLISGLFYNTLYLRTRKFGIYLSLIAAMVGGRIVYAAALFVSANMLSIPSAKSISVISAVATGAIGIAIQLLLIPAVVYALERSGHLDRFIGTRKKTSV